jgi:Fe-Mn family superoxide dismutase
MFSLPDLPYAYEALEPTMSANTLHYHHDKHHAAYVRTLNELLEKAGESPGSLEDVIREAANGGGKAKLFNNAAQAWNHAFFWLSMSPTAGKPGGELAQAIEAAFGDLNKLGETFVEKGVARFGSGWAWLVSDRSGKLSVETTHDAKDMVTEAATTPLLVCDVWEHAYYLDYQNDRKKFLTSWFDTLPDWGFAASQYAAAKGDGQAWSYPAPGKGVGAKAA